MAGEQQKAGSSRTQAEAKYGAIYRRGARGGAAARR